MTSLPAFQGSTSGSRDHKELVGRELRRPYKSLDN